MFIYLLFSVCLNQLVESVGLAEDDIDSTRTSLPPQTKLQERTVSQQRTTGHFLRFLCLLNLCSLTTYLFTSFSGNRPAQWECVRTGFRSHAKCHPYPIPQPLKVGHTTGVYDPYSFRIVKWVLLRATRTNQWECCKTGPTVFRPYPRRLESLTICRCHYKGNTFFSVI